MSARDETDLEAVERALRAQEAELETREQALTVREVEAAADVLGVEGRCRIVQRRLRALEHAGSEEANGLILALPRLGPPPGTAARLSAVEVRREALAAREAAAFDRQRALDFVNATLEEARGRLEVVEGRLEQLEGPAEDEISMSATPVPPREPTPPPVVAQPSPEASRRIAPRVRVDCSVNLETPDNFFTGFARDVSEGGLFVASFDLLPVGTEVDLNFALPTGEPIRVRSVVRWVRDLEGASPGVWPGMGLAFVDLETDAQGRIEQFTRRREPLFYPD